MNDICLFFLQESNFKTRNLLWHYARVTKVSGSRLTLEYCISSSSTKRVIERSKRQVVRVATEEELNLTNQKRFENIVKISGVSKLNV